MIELYVGGHAGTVQGEREDLMGKRMFSAAHKPQAARIAPLDDLEGWLDSGAFSDKPEDRLELDQALDRQFAFEQTACRIWKGPWQARGFVSYDLLIDETWVQGEKLKRRWSVQDAELAVGTTVAAAAYLDSQRQRTGARTLIMSAQGVDALQYAECAAGVLRHTQPHDVFGFGGWCILGRQKRLLPEFWATMRLVLPMLSYAGVKRAHIFGVLWLPALGGMLWLADQYKIQISTDSTAPVLACTWKDQKKSGARMPYWRDNVRWWQDALATLRTSPHYKEPPDMPAIRQESFL